MITWDAEERVLVALASGVPAVDACLEGPMSPRTLRRRLTEDREFRARLEVKLAVVSVELDRGLRALAAKSLRVLVKVLDNDWEPALQVRVGLGVFSSWIRTRGYEQDERMQKLEALAHEAAETLERIQDALGPHFLAEDAAAASRTRDRDTP